MTTDAILATLCLAGFAVLFYGPWQDACTDFARQIVFEQRDKLFDMARAGKLDFKSDEYKTIRSGLESMIRFAHELTMPRLIWVTSASTLRPDAHSPIIAAIAKVKDESVQEQLVDIHRVVYNALVIMMGFKSLICVVFFPFFIVGYLASLTFSTVSNACKKYVMKTGEIIQTEAMCAQ